MSCVHESCQLLHHAHADGAHRVTRVTRTSPVDAGGCLLPRRSAEMGRSKSPAEAPTPRHYVVLVLGDVGRSPRMQYHTVSLADMPGTKHPCERRWQPPRLPS